MSRPLVLVPTDLERRTLRPLLAAACGDCPVEVCGFGPVAAAARTAGLLAALRPGRVVLVGIAGSLDERLAVGSAHRFDAVACHGVGAGTGGSFVPAEALGWPQWPGGPDGRDPEIGDVVSLDTVPGAGPPPAGLLLTACAAAAGPDDVHDRRRLFPTAVAEDMEGFGVALACRLAGTPIEIVRGISNVAGDRDTVRWRIEEALASAAMLARRVLEAAP